MIFNLTEISSDTIDEQIVYQITRKILNDEIQPGYELEPANLVARRNHITKNYVRKAYETLQNLNVVKNDEKLGMIIKEIDDNQKSVLKSQLFLMNYPERTDENSKYMEDLDRELRLAHQIQKDLLPGQNLNFSGMEIFAYIKPAKVVSGDFYDYFILDENRLGLVIADASGKGMPAAILISQIQAILKSELGNGCKIEEVFKKLNKHLVENSSSKNFTTLFYAIYNKNLGSLEYCNAGHNFPILIKKDGNFELLKTTGPALGFIKEFNYSTKSTRMDIGDILILYTDGISETMNDLGEQFGEGRLIEELINNRDFPAEEITNRIKSKINEFKSVKFSQDDSTLLVIKRTDYMKNNN